MSSNIRYTVYAVLVLTLFGPLGYVAERYMDSSPRHLAKLKEKLRIDFEYEVRSFGCSRPQFNSLLAKKPDVNLKYRDGNAALHLIAKSELLATDCIRALVKTHNANINILNSLERTPLMVAIASGNYDAAKALISLGAITNNVDATKKNLYAILEESSTYTNIAKKKAFARYLVWNKIKIADGMRPLNSDINYSLFDRKSFRALEKKEIYLDGCDHCEIVSSSDGKKIAAYGVSEEKKIVGFTIYNLQGKIISSVDIPLKLRTIQDQPPPKLSPTGKYILYTEVGHRKIEVGHRKYESIYKTRMLNLETKKIVWEDDGASGYDFKYTRSGKYLISVDGKRALSNYSVINIIEVSTGKKVYSYKVKQRLPISEAYYNEESKVIYFHYKETDKRIFFAAWSTKLKKILFRKKLADAYKKFVYYLDYKHRIIMTSTIDKKKGVTFKLWHMETGKYISQLVYFHDYGRRYIENKYDDLYRLSTVKPLLITDSNDGKYIVTKHCPGFRMATVIVWSRSLMKPIAIYEHRSGGCGNFSIATNDQNGGMRILVTRPRYNGAVPFILNLK